MSVDDFHSKNFGNKMENNKKKKHANVENNSFSPKYFRWKNEVWRMIKRIDSSLSIFYLERYICSSTADAYEQ